MRWAALTVSAALAVAFAAPAAQGPPALERFTVSSDGHPVALWARRPPAPRATVVLVHGRTWSARPDFDLDVPGLGRSTLSALAARGVAAYAVDLRGYGATPRDPAGWLTPRRAAADLTNVLRWVAAEHATLPKPGVVGWSRGAAIAMLSAQAEPRAISALVLYGFVFDPDLEFGDPEVEAPDRETLSIRNTADAARSDFISPAVTPRAVVEAFVTQALRADPLLAPLASDDEFNDLDPRRLLVPTLLLYGSRDPAVSPEIARKFMNRLAARPQDIVVLNGADHAAHLEDTHEAWLNAVNTFITRAAAAGR